MKLRKKLERFLGSLYYDVHAIYDPEGLGVSYLGEYYSAAVDLFEPGITFRLYFKITENGTIHIVDVQRWYMG